MVKMAEDFLVIKEMPGRELLTQWEAFLSDTSFVSHYVTPDFFLDPFVGVGDRCAILTVEQDRITAVLTGLRTKRTFAAGLAVRPQIAFRDDADKASAGEAIANGLAALCGPTVELISLFSWEQIAGLDRFGYEQEVSSGADRVCILDLEKGSEALFKEFSERRRTDLRKVMKQGILEVKMLETEDELTELYKVHQDWNRRKGNIPHPFFTFQKILCSEHRATLIAIHDRTVIAGTYLRFCKGGSVEYAANNSLSEFNNLRANELLGWRAIEWACSAGFKRFSLGGSHPFLTRFGGELFAARRYRLDRTFFKHHEQRERLSRLAVRTYMSLPERWRRSIKSVATT